MKKTILALLLVSMGTPTLAAIIVPARAVVIAHPVATAKPTVATKPANTYKPVPRAPVYIRCCSVNAIKTKRANKAV